MNYDEEHRCPQCGNDSAASLIKQMTDIENDVYIIAYECKKCKTEFNQWFNIEYDYTEVIE